MKRQVGLVGGYTPFKDVPPDFLARLTPTLIHEVIARFCQQCHGSGLILEIKWTAWIGGFKYTTLRICETCGGSGERPR